jgi:hypothetical protein
LLGAKGEVSDDIAVMAERESHFAVQPHHSRDFHPSHHSRNRGDGFERGSRDREAYNERDREKERDNNRDRERVDREKERDREKEKDRSRDRDKERERERERERELSYGDRNGHGHVGPGRETGPPPPPPPPPPPFRREGGFDQLEGGRDGGNSRYDREDRFVSAGWPFPTTPEELETPSITSVVKPLLAVSILWLVLSSLCGVGGGRRDLVMGRNNLHGKKIVFCEASLPEKKRIREHACCSEFCHQHLQGFISLRFRPTFTILQFPHICPPLMFWAWAGT